MTDQVLTRTRFNSIFDFVVHQFLLGSYEQGLERIYCPASAPQLFHQTNLDYVNKWIEDYYKQRTDSKKRRAELEDKYSQESEDGGGALHILGLSGVGKYQLLKCISAQYHYDTFERNLAHRLNLRDIANIEEATQCRNLQKESDNTKRNLFQEFQQGKQEEKGGRKIIIIQNYDQMVRLDKRLIDTFDMLIADSKHPFIFTSEYMADSHIHQQYHYQEQEKEVGHVLFYSIVYMETRFRTAYKQIQSYSLLDQNELAGQVEQIYGQVPQIEMMSIQQFQQFLSIYRHDLRATINRIQFYMGRLNKQQIGSVIEQEKVIQRQSLQGLPPLKIMEMDFRQLHRHYYKLDQQIKHDHKHDLAMLSLTDDLLLMDQIIQQDLIQSACPAHKQEQQEQSLMILNRRMAVPLNSQHQYLIDNLDQQIRNLQYLKHLTLFCQQDNQSVYSSQHNYEYLPLILWSSLLGPAHKHSLRRRRVDTDTYLDRYVSPKEHAQCLLAHSAAYYLP